MQTHKSIVNTARILLILIVALSWSIQPAHAKKIEELDRIIAVVGNDVITKSELAKQISLVRIQLKKNKTQIPSQSVLQRQVLERMIVDKIQLQLAKRRGIRVSDETINRVIANMAKENKLSLDKFRKVLAKDGVSFSEFRTNIKEKITLERLKNQIVDKEVTITKQEVNNYLARSKARGDQSSEYLLSHIMISIPEAATPEQINKSKSKADKILKQLKKGADFAKTAISNSDGQQALKGGKLGWLKGAQLPALFEDAISSMKTGQMSSVIRSPSGFHIIKLNNKRSTNKKHIVKQALSRHILIKPDTVNSKNAVKKKLQNIRKQVIAGGDFAKLAQQHSQDKGSSIDGGNLGWSSPGNFVPEFEKELSRLKPGELSPVFKSRYGWHLLQLMSRRKHDDSDEHNRLQIKKLIHKRKSNEVLNNWIRRIRDEAYVEYHLNN